MLAALGARFLDADGRAGRPWRRPLRDLATADLSGLDPRLARTEIVLASDVDNPLHGSEGRPGGLRPAEGRERGGRGHAGRRARRTTPRCWSARSGPKAAEHALAPGAGAAGGIGYGALVGLDAAFRPGIDVMLDVLGFAPALAEATFVITGEGSLDAQTLHGKAPAGVAAAARAAGLDVVAVCGRLAADRRKRSALRASGGPTP